MVFIAEIRNTFEYGSFAILEEVQRNIFNE